MIIAKAKYKAHGFNRVFFVALNLKAVDVGPALSVFLGADRAFVENS